MEKRAIRGTRRQLEQAELEVLPAVVVAGGPGEPEAAGKVDHPR